MALFMPDPKTESPIELGMGLTNVPFAVPNLRVENPEAAAHTRVGWYRAVSNIPHAFAIQSFVGEMAHAAGRDPKDFLLELLGPPRKIDPRDINDTWNHGEDPTAYPVDIGRLRRVTTTAAKEANWGRQLPKGRGLGIAAHYSFTTYVAAVVEVAVDAKGELTIPRVDIAIDCGAHRQSRAGALADGGRLRDGHRQCAVAARSRSRTAACSRTTSTSSRCCA